MFCLLERESALSENRLLVSLLARARELAIPLPRSVSRLAGRWAQRHTAGAHDAYASAPAAH